MIKITFESLLIHSITPQTKASSQNALGEWSYTYTDGTDITCRCSPLTAAQTMNISGWYDDVKYNCFMDDSESVARGDRVEYGSDTYRVKEVILDSSSHHKTALLVLVT